MVMEFFSNLGAFICTFRGEILANPMRFKIVLFSKFVIHVFSAAPSGEWQESAATNNAWYSESVLPFLFCYMWHLSYEGNMDI